MTKEIKEARRLMRLALDFWSAPGIDMPEIGTFDGMVAFLENTGEPYKEKYDDMGRYIGDTMKPIGMTREEFEAREDAMVDIVGERRVRA
jgi:hypothetical protein